MALVTTTARPPDTSREAWDALTTSWVDMTSPERIAVADRLSRDVARLAIIGIRQAHPEFSDVDVMHELTRRRFGSPLADAAFEGRRTVER